MWVRRRGLDADSKNQFTVGRVFGYINNKKKKKVFTKLIRLRGRFGSARIQVGILDRIDRSTRIELTLPT